MILLHVLPQSIIIRFTDRLCISNNLHVWLSCMTFKLMCMNILIAYCVYLLVNLKPSLRQCMFCPGDLYIFIKICLRSFI